MSSVERPAVADGVIAKRVGDETVLLDYERGVYYGLGNTGAFIWDRIAENRSVAEIVEAMLAEYDVQREEVERDVDALLSELASHGLIRR